METRSREPATGRLAASSTRPEADSPHLAQVELVSCRCVSIVYARMSYDLQVWSISPAPSHSLDCLPDAINWKRSEESLIYQKRSWALLRRSSVQVLPEDMPLEVSRSLPGIGYLTELNLSPINAPVGAQKFALRTAVAIAKASHGVVFDPQNNTLTLPSGVCRYIKPQADENASVPSFSWWFVDGPIAEKNFRALIDVLDAELPEAMPRRYGLFEPPQHIYANEGRAHFLNFLAGNASGIGIVWYPNPPVFGVYLHLPSPIGASKRGFRAGKLSIDIDLEALKQPGWQSSMRRMWNKVSTLVQPFYGDVRTLRGFRRHRGRLFADRDTIRHPVKGGWWPGIPSGPSQAIVLGTRYAELWPLFSAAAEKTSDLYFIDTVDWSASADVYDRIGGPPAEIMQRDATSAIPTEYPVGWPFEPPTKTH